MVCNLSETSYFLLQTEMAIHFSLQLWQAHLSLKMRWRIILFESGNLQSMYVHFHLYLSFIKCHFNLHLGPDKKSKIDTKIEKTSHIWYKLSYLLLGSEFLKNSGGSSSYMSHGKYFHKTRGDQNFCHEWSRWLRNSSIILIGIPSEKQSATAMNLNERLREFK